MSDLDAAEQRQSRRRPVGCPAWIDFGDGGKPRACTVWDVSDDGVRIACEMPADVPKQFMLQAGHGADRRRCQVIWRSTQEIGARYLDLPEWRPEASNWTA